MLEIELSDQRSFSVAVKFNKGLRLYINYQEKDSHARVRNLRTFRVLFQVHEESVPSLYLNLHRLLSIVLDS